MTFSIVAVDREQDEVGFAIASCSWDAGQVCFARAGLGAIASQAKGNLKFLGRYFELLPNATSGEQILDAFRAEDEAIETRQVGLASFAHAPISFTGSACSPWAGHHVGEDYACQGNILVGPQVVQEMARAFEQTTGVLHERLFAAVQAGDAVGGDLRGRQSARLCVKKCGWGQPETDTLIDLTIEDHDDPVAELERILKIRNHLSTILGLLAAAEAAEGSKQGEILDRLRDVLTDKLTPRYLDWWETLAHRCFEAGLVDRAVEAYRTYLSINPAMQRVLAADVAAGKLPAQLAQRLELVE